MIFAPTQQPLHMAILVLTDSNMLAFAAALDSLRAANRVSHKKLFTWSIHSPEGRSVELTSGLSIAADPLPNSLANQALLIVAGFNLQKYATRQLLRQINKLASSALALGGVDAGGLVLARTGLLNGHRATTQWEDLEEMRSGYPEIDVVPDRFVISGRMFTCGGASACIDMMLHLIATRCGLDISERVAAAFTYDAARPGGDPQSLVSIARLKTYAPKLARAISEMESHLEESLTIAAIADRVGLSRRRLEMLFQGVIGRAPASYYRQLRLAEAHRMALDTALPLQDIAVRCGFNSQSAFSRAFAAQYGSSPSILRKANTGFRVGLSP
ncbi:MAG: transcriptional regulator GlxA family with amidase domain [Halioglobus sp.]|jgi:transcriptional regulator GlxA family with amidase domain